MGYFEKLFYLNLEDYGGTDFSIGLPLICIFLGLIIATVIVGQTNRTVYRTLKALHRHKAESAETAKSLKALGLSSDRSVVRAIQKKNAMLMRYICAKAAAAKASAEASIDAPMHEEKGDAAAEAAPMSGEKSGEGKERFEEFLYYINPAMADRAAEILGGSEPTVLQTVFYCAIYILLYFGVASILPLALSVLL